MTIEVRRNSSSVIVEIGRFAVIGYRGPGLLHGSVCFGRAQLGLTLWHKHGFTLLWRGADVLTVWCGTDWAPQ